MSMNQPVLFLVGLLVFFVFVAAIVATLMKLNRRRPDRFQNDGLHREDGLKTYSSGTGAETDLSGGRDVSAALGVQQSAGLPLEGLPPEPLKRSPRIEDSQGVPRDMF
jgi:hypothetical protein